MAGPIDVPDAFTIDTQITPFILGADPLASERIWDQLYRFMIHGRKGSPMFAISAIDTALWDLKGKMARSAALPPAGRAGSTRDPGLCERSGLLN